MNGGGSACCATEKATYCLPANSIDDSLDVGWQVGHAAAAGLPGCCCGWLRLWLATCVQAAGASRRVELGSNCG